MSTETAGQTASSATGADPVSSTTSQSSTSRSETATTAPGNTSPLTFTPPVVPELSSFGATGALQGAIGMDAMARYSAATALFQEVQLLNRYVREATIRRNAMPYGVRLQVSVLPVLRGQAYDASTTISFFSGCSGFRLGAMLQAESRYAMVPRTHNVTLLVFVPKGAREPLECARVRMIARTEITDAVRGKVLPSRTREQVTQLVHDVAGRYALPGDADGYERLRLYAQQNDYLNFENELVAMYKVEANDPGQRRLALQYAEAIWLELTGILVGSQYSPSFFELPAPRRVALAKGGAALVVDDTKTQTVATVPGGNDLVASELSATLYVKEAAGSEFPVAATRAEVFENNQVAQFVFRSIAPLIADPKTATFRLEIARVAPPGKGQAHPSSRTRPSNMSQ